MENTTFIPANQLPEAEGYEVSVLCVEDGELKQKPAKGLGGGGGADLIFHLDGYATSVAAGSFDDVANKFRSCGIPNIQAYELSKEEYDEETGYQVSPISVEGYSFHEFSNPADSYIEVYCRGSSILLTLRPDGVVEFNDIG